MRKESGNAYKVRVLLSLLALPYEQIIVDPSGKDPSQSDFWRKNPRGQVPMLEDHGKYFWDSSACLVYIARMYGGDKWLPATPVEMAEVLQWIALAGNEIQYGLQYGRRGVQRGIWVAGGLEQSQALGRIALKTLEARLTNHDWLALNHPTIGDIACFSYVETAPESGLSLDSFPGIVSWLERCRNLKGWPAR